MVALSEQRLGWGEAALRNFRQVWDAMTVENRGRFLRALVVHVRVMEQTGAVEIELANLGAAEPREAA